jgi:hypothetical protein
MGAVGSASAGAAALERNVRVIAGYWGGRAESLFESQYRGKAQGIEAFYGKALCGNIMAFHRPWIGAFDV